METEVICLVLKKCWSVARVCDFFSVNARRATCARRGRQARRPFELWSFHSFSTSCSCTSPCINYGLAGIAHKIQNCRRTISPLVLDNDECGGCPCHCPKGILSATPRTWIRIRGHNLILIHALALGRKSSTFSVRIENRLAWDWPSAWSCYPDCSKSHRSCSKHVAWVYLCPFSLILRVWGTWMNVVH